MDTNALKKFAQKARRQLIEQVTTRLDYVLYQDSVELREKEQAIKELRSEIRKSSREEVIDQVAYTWFNRFCALRYMDVNHYTRVGIVSPQAGHTQPEILQDAKQGLFEPTLLVDQDRVKKLLSNQLRSSNPQQEAYRLLLVGACNTYHKQMPFLFPKIDDYTELLMPEDLLSENSVLYQTREVLTGNNCQDVEVIGWLYQFYISERKDEVFAENKSVESKDIPAITQLFTPDYIVRYLVQNSLGKLWLLNNPQSKIIDEMDFYIPTETIEDYIKLNSPEEIKICDPACGSGHILTYAFDLLYSIYEEQGYDTKQIPSLIIEKNIFGIEIDRRAGNMAAFALMMKAREYDRRFFSRDIEPNICVLEDISFTTDEIKDYKKAVGKTVFTQDLWFLLQQFENTKTLGSLIKPQIKKPRKVREHLNEQGLFDDLFLMNTSNKVKKALTFAEYLSPRYQVVLANPPYMGGKSMNVDLKKYAKDMYPNSKSELGTIFIERNLDLVRDQGFVSMITMQSWMFLSSFDKLRTRLISNLSISSMVHLGASAFDTIGGEVVQTTAFVLNKLTNENKGSYLRVIDGKFEDEKICSIQEAIQNPECGWFYTASTQDFKKIPGSPIAYWVSDRVREVFFKNFQINKFAETRIGLVTGDNNYYIRFWYEIDKNDIYNGQIDNKKWVPISKGGRYRKWYGNNETVINWENDGYEIKNRKNDSETRVLAHNFNSDKLFEEGITWTAISSGNFSPRIHPKYYIFTNSANAAFVYNEEFLLPVLGFFGSKLFNELVGILNPSLNFLPGYISSVPFNGDIVKDKKIIEIIKSLILISKKDWNSFEISWDFLTSPFLSYNLNKSTLSDVYCTIRQSWKKISYEMLELEKENNRIILENFGLLTDYSPDVSLKSVSLLCNPYYRYQSDNNDEKLEKQLLKDSLKELLSFFIGCIFGRYSLDKEGFILANQGDSINYYLNQIPNPSFFPDEKNIVPFLDDTWFENDVIAKFYELLKISFGEENFDENLEFIENAIEKDIRFYFLKDFYSDHIKMYKKRPIYWMFSSSKGSFNALIYMHRYNSDTVSVVLNDYLIPYREKLKAQINILQKQGESNDREKIRTDKEITKINKILVELKEYEDEVLYPLATEKIDIDLDDGVKVNYNKFGKALKKVAGLSK